MRRPRCIRSGRVAFSMFLVMFIRVQVYKAHPPTWASPADRYFTSPHWILGKHPVHLDREHYKRRLRSLCSQAVCPRGSHLSKTLKQVCQTPSGTTILFFN